jgi:outer membrane protein OmpA-like peptidoglycan-associated protein
MKKSSILIMILMMTIRFAIIKNMERHLILLISLVLAFQNLFAQKANLVKNGTFEMGRTGFKTDYNLLEDNSNPGEYDVTDDVTHYGPFNNPLPSTGKFLYIDAFEYLDTVKIKRSSYESIIADTPAYLDTVKIKRCWYDSVSVKPNTTYVFSCSVASVLKRSPAELKFNVNSHRVSGIFYVSDNYWQIISTKYTTKRKQARIEISIVDVNKESNYGNDFAIDNIVFEPEKETPSVIDATATAKTPVVVEKVKEPEKVIAKEILSVVKKDSVIAPVVADFKKDISIDEINPGLKLQLSHIYFELAKFNLLSASLPELNDLVTFMKKYPTVRIRLEGHTDNQADPQLNLELSENRAKEVKKYLVEQSIDENRIEWIGYGEQRPTNNNSTEYLRQKNRRVGIVIISK